MAASAKTVNARAIYSALRNEIVSGDLAPGTPMREVSLAARFGVSRTPIREVMRQLLNDGLLERGASGVQVATSDVERTIQVYDARILLEGQVVTEAAENRRSSDLFKLQRLLDRDRALVDPPIGQRVTTNLEFHSALWDAAHNAVLSEILERLALNGVSTPQTTLNDDDRWTIALDEHAAMLAAIEARDGERASELAKRHLTEARDIRIQRLTQIDT